MSHPLKCLMLLALLALGTAEVDPRLNAIGVAWADDDDDGGDDDDDDDDDDGNSGGGGSDARSGGNNEMPRFLRRIFRQEEPRRVVRTAPPPRPAYRPEIVAMNLSVPDLEVLLGEGFAVIEEQSLAGFGVTMRRLRAPDGVALETARDRVRTLASGQSADFNHYYRAEEGDCEGPHCGSAEQIGWTIPDTRDACGPEIVVGIVDTGLNPDHATFADARLDVHRIDGTDTPSREMHGTSVAALLVGAPGGRSPGLVPDIRLVAVDAFHHTGGDERADAFTLIRALSHLSDAGARVVNLSLAGPSNSVLEQAVARMVEEQVVIVAAAGNGGARAAPAYPAAYEDVIAVTAVDRQGNVYRRAGRGAHVDLAAPGVEVWTAASISGGRLKTGTSYAAPFVTAAVVRMLQADPSATPVQIAERLTAAATDLGDPGYDGVYGHGLVGAAPCMVAITQDR